MTYNTLEHVHPSPCKCEQCLYYIRLDAPSDREMEKKDFHRFIVPGGLTAY